MFSVPRPPSSTLFPYTTLFRSGCTDHSRSLPWLEPGDGLAVCRRAGLAGTTPNSQPIPGFKRTEEHTSELQSPVHLVFRLLVEKKNSTEQKTVKQTTGS